VAYERVKPTYNLVICYYDKILVNVAAYVIPGVCVCVCVCVFVVKRKQEVEVVICWYIRNIYFSLSVSVKKLYSFVVYSLCAKNRPLYPSLRL
jgi:hypothetical protein